jgi:hypothetical protein
VCGRGRRSVAITVVAAFRVVDVDTGGGMVGVLVDCVLHLAENGIDVDEVLLGASARHRQVILLSQGVLARWWAGVNRSWGVLGHVLLSSSHRAVGDGQVAVKGHQRAANDHNHRRRQYSQDARYGRC